MILRIEKAAKLSRCVCAHVKSSKEVVSERQNAVLYSIPLLKFIVTVCVSILGKLSCWARLFHLPQEWWGTLKFGYNIDDQIE